MDADSRFSHEHVDMESQWQHLRWTAPRHTGQPSNLVGCSIAWSCHDGSASCCSSSASSSRSTRSCTWTGWRERMRVVEGQSRADTRRTRYVFELPRVPILWKQCLRQDGTIWLPLRIVDSQLPIRNLSSWHRFRFHVSIPSCERYGFHCIVKAVELY